MRKKRSEKIVSVFESVILIVSIIAFAWMIGSEFKLVSAPTYSFSGSDATEGVKKTDWWALVFAVAGFGTSFLGNGGGIGTSIGNLIGGGGGSVIGGIVNALMYAYAAANLYKVIFSSFASGRNMRAIFNDWVFYGSVVLSAVITIVIIAILGESFTGPLGWIAAAIEVVLLSIWAMFTYQDYSAETFAYVASQWQPAARGENCEKCNDLPFGCSEYQCHSFGLGCNITNPGTKQEACIWQSKGDLLGPEITPLTSVLDPGFSYQPLNSVAPPNKGVKVIYQGEGQDANFCIPPFTDLTIGVSTNKVAHCKIDLEDKKNLTDMSSEMKEGYVYVINHTLWIPSSVNPSQSALDNATFFDENGNPVVLSAGQDRNFYIRCASVNGYESAYNFLMQFCVQSGPDVMSPIIRGTNYLSNNSYISFNSNQAYLQVYTNEPADCKWDFQDVTYDDMKNNMSGCSQNLTQFLLPSTLTYGCETNLTGIKNEQDNNYYIRCKDQPWLKNTQDEVKRNANKHSYLLTLMGTSDLVIENVSVNSKANNSVIKDSANQTEIVLRVDTAGGAQNGNAKCQYKIGDNWNFFYNDGNLDFIPENSQKLWLTPGTYNYPVRCFDIGGNVMYDSIGFVVEQDVTAPNVVRVYSENNQIKIMTNEESECVYSITGCGYQFSDGTQMSTTDNLAHYADWTTDTDLFIKCKDLFGNKPSYNSCSIIVRGSQF